VSETGFMMRNISPTSGQLNWGADIQGSKEE